MDCWFRTPATAPRVEPALRVRLLSDRLASASAVVLLPTIDTVLALSAWAPAARASLLRMVVVAVALMEASLPVTSWTFCRDRSAETLPVVVLFAFSVAP